MWKCSCRPVNGPCAIWTAATARSWASQVVTGDWSLKPGDVIRIGHTQLVFVHKLSDAFSDSGALVHRSSSDTAPIEEDAKDSASVLTAKEPTTITHRRVQTKFLIPGEEDESGVSKVGHAAAKLCRLAFELAKAPDITSLAETALKGLAEGTSEPIPVRC